MNARIHDTHRTETHRVAVQASVSGAAPVREGSSGIDFIPRIIEVEYSCHGGKWRHNGIWLRAEPVYGHRERRQWFPPDKAPDWAQGFLFDNTPQDHLGGSGEQEESSE